MDQPASAKPSPSFLTQEENDMRHIVLASCLLLFVSSLLRPAHALSAEDWEIKIIRTSLNTNSITGELYVKGAFVAHTLELPWNNNKSYISSIPDGKYSANLRYDKPDGWRIELKNVVGRTGVQIHLGNYPADIEGCVLVGKKVVNKENRLEQSKKAYADLCKAFYGTETPNSTPNVNISVKIEYQRSNTTFSGDNLLMQYQGSGRWISSYSPRPGYQELFRDEGYIYLLGDGGDNFYLRYPLFGGVTASAYSVNGPWKNGVSQRRKD